MNLYGRRCVVAICASNRIEVWRVVLLPFHVSEMFATLYLLRSLLP